MAESAMTSKGIAKDFTRATPPAHRRAAGDPHALARLAAIDERADAVKVKVVAHFRKFEDRWVAKEAIALWKRHLLESARHPLPPDTRPDVSEADMMRMAARNVEARVNRRLSRVNGMRTRLQNAMVRTISQPSLSGQFEQAAPAIKQRSKRIIRD